MSTATPDTLEIPPTFVQHSDVPDRREPHIRVCFEKLKKLRQTLTLLGRSRLVDHPAILAKRHIRRQAARFRATPIH
jgi:hypothetical protein